MQKILLIFIMWLGLKANSQVSSSYPPLLQKLASTPGAVNSILLHNDSFLKGLPYPFENTGCSFLKTPEALVALVNGTGRVYALDTTQSPAAWVRKDSTFFSGYNLGCLNFFADSTIWSYGGYGLWNNNGHLRYFASNKYEWEIKALNREVPHIFQVKDMFYLDTTAGYLYLQGIHVVNDALKSNDELEKEFSGKTWRLDIRKGDWEILGASPDTSLFILAHSPWGALTLENGKPGIADFAHNRYLHTSDQGMRKFSQYTNSTKVKKMSFFVDSTLYFGDLELYIDSINFAGNDFYDSGKSIYRDPAKSTNIFLGKWAILLYLFAGAAALWLLVKRKKSKAVTAANFTTPVEPTFQNKADNTHIESTPEFEPYIDRQPPIASAPLQNATPLDNLDERDRSLLFALAEKARSQKNCDIETLNTLLGVSNKSLEVQKRQRSDALSALNKKMSKLLDTEEELIIRTRSEQDRRTYYYTVNPVLAEQLDTLLSAKNTG